MRICSGRQRRLTMLTLCAALATSTAFAASAEAAKKPDLVVVKAEGHGKEYAYQGSSTDVFFSFAVKNVGNAPARASVARVRLRHGDNKYTLGEVDVPRLTVDRKRSYVVPDVDDPNLRFNYPLGAYEVQICADAIRQVEESDERNNCETVEEPDRFRHLYVAKQTWDGTLSGTSLLAGGFGGNVHERWSSDDASFKAIGYQGNGSFVYWFFGSVTWTDSGIDAAGFRWSGGGTRTFGASIRARGNMIIDYLKETYHGGTGADRTFYNITNTGGIKLPGPGIGTFWTSGAGQTLIRPFPFDTRTLAGQTNGPAGERWTWNLR